MPQVFFYIDQENKNLVIDGQQRILSVAFFFEGYFGFENLQGRRTVFRLTGLPLDSPYSNKKFDELSQGDQRRLRGAVLRAVNIKQLAPTNQSTSMYHIFERLNTGGTPLKPQEIRNCVFHGKIVEELHQLNANATWRSVLGRKDLDKFQRDVELLLRIFAFSERGNKYEKPMKEFLNQTMKDNAKDKSRNFADFASRFEKVLKIVSDKFKPKPFHVRGPLNLAATDSVLSVLVNNLEKIPKDVGERYQKLLANEEFRKAVFFNTSDSSTVKVRLQLAQSALIG